MKIAHILFCCMALLLALPAFAQRLEAGMETTFGRSYASFKGDLSQMVGFSELELTQAEVDTALTRFNISAPRWLKELFPGLRIDIPTDISKRQSRSVKAARFFVRYAWLGGSFTVSDPRLSPQLESEKLGNQVKSIRLSLKGDAEALAEHLALMALADETQVKPFFKKRYDIEGYVDLKKMLMPDQRLLEWGKRGQAYIDAEVVTGLRFSADPSPVIDLGSILFVKETLDDLMEGGFLAPVEKTTDKLAEAIQNTVFGKFRDPRVVPSFGWFVRGSVPVNFGGDLSLVAGGELGIQKHTSISGTKPLVGAYAFAGIRWRFIQAFNENNSRRKPGSKK